MHLGTGWVRGAYVHTDYWLAAGVDTREEKLQALCVPSSVSYLHVKFIRFVMIMEFGCSCIWPFCCKNALGVYLIVDKKEAI